LLGRDYSRSKLMRVPLTVELTSSIEKSAVPEVLLDEHVLAVVDLDLVGLLVERLPEGVADVARAAVLAASLLELHGMSTARRPSA
jgi:hypothetical protein